MTSKYGWFPSVWCGLASIYEVVVLKLQHGEGNRMTSKNRKHVSLSVFLRFAANVCGVENAST